MKKIFILSILIALPFFVSAATYSNKTSTPFMISKSGMCTDEEIVQFQDSSFSEIVDGESTLQFVLSELEPCVKNESREILPNESIEFDNEQGQPVTISSRNLNEKREFFPTNDAFNYEITISKYPSKFSKITINSGK